MKVLTFTTLFPNNINKNSGVFIKNRMFHFQKNKNINLKIVAPVPYFPPIKLNHEWYKFSQIKKNEVQGNVEVYHPRYLITPKIGMMLYGFNMFWGTLPCMKKIYTNFKFDIIDAHYIYPDCLAAILLGKYFNVPVIVSARGTDINIFPKYKTIKPQIKAVLNKANGIISVSKALSDIVKSINKNKQEINIIANGIDINKFFPISSIKARELLGLPLREIIVLSVGRLIKLKGHHILIEAVNELKKKYPDILLVIIGEGDFRKKLEYQITKLKLSKNVKLIGQIPHTKLKYWYNACNTLCLASSNEGWPNVLLEAMACGKPVVGTKTGGVPEIISSIKLGYLVPQRTSSQFAKYLDLTLEKEWDSKSIVKYAQKHSWSNVSDLLYTLFENIIQSY